MPQSKPMPVQPGGYTSSAGIAPSNTVRIGPCKAIYVGVTGDVAVQLPGVPSPTVFAGVPAGTTLPIRPAFVRSTGTTATGLLRLW